LGGIPPAEPREFRSDIFKQTPPVELNDLMDIPYKLINTKRRAILFIIAVILGAILYGIFGFR